MKSSIQSTNLFSCSPASTTQDDWKYKDNEG